MNARHYLRAVLVIKKIFVFLQANCAHQRHFGHISLGRSAMYFSQKRKSHCFNRFYLAAPLTVRAFEMDGIIKSLGNALT